jgi:hypothetical protein
MKNKIVLVLLLFLFVPLVFGETYKRAQTIELPPCFGITNFSVQSTTPTVAGYDYTFEGCSQPTICDCTSPQRTIYFSVLDNTSNDFQIIGDYFISPKMDYDPNSGLVDPNDATRRFIRIENLQVRVNASSVVEEKSSGVPVDATTTMLIIMGVLVLVGGGGFLAFKLLSRDTTPKKALPKKVSITNTDEDDVRKYLRDLEMEERK